MKSNYSGSWENNGESLTIQQNGKTYTCSLPRKNIGMCFNNNLVVSEFDDATQSAGVGVYSPIGDGYSIYALWSSTGILGQLGSGIALRCDEFSDFEGEYTVQYFVRNREGASFLVRIDKAENEDIYKLLWFKDDKIALHGIGFIVEKSLAFAWGSIDCKFGFNTFNYCDDNSTKKIKRQTVIWDSDKIERNDYIRA